jgi:hypothetical protein
MKVELFRDLLPPEPGPKFDFWTPSNAKPERVLSFSVRPWAHYVHWTGDVTEPCTLVLGLEGQVTQHCDGCTAQQPRRYKGYLHVLRYSQGAQCFLCLTPNAGHFVETLVRQGEDLRGLSLDVWRVNGQKTAELVVRVNTTFSRSPVAIPELDPGPYLDTVFRRRKPRRRRA